MIWRYRTLAVLIVVALLVAGSGGATAQSSTTSAANVSVDSVSFSPNSPEVDTPATVTATIANLESSTDAVTIQRVSVIDSTGTRSDILATARSLGAIAPGGEMAVPVAVTFETPGRKELRVQVYGVDQSGSAFEFEYPAVVTVDESPRVQLHLSGDEAVAGAEMPITATVSNAEPEALENLELRIGGPAVTATDDRRINASLAAGRERSFDFDVTFTEPGSQTVSATLTYTGPGGVAHSVSESRQIEVGPLIASADLDAGTADENASAVLEATLANLGNAALEDVTISVSSPAGETLRRATLADIEPDRTGTTTFAGTHLETGTLTVRAEYTVGDTSQTRSATVEFQPAETSRIELTGIDMTARGGIVTLTGSAGNTGMADASSVIVSIVEAEGVTPTPPSQDYFIGTIESSDYISFELSATTAPDVSTIPVRIDYTVDGERHSEVVQVATGGSASAAPGFGGPRGSGGPGDGGPGGPPGLFGALPLGELVGLLLRGALVLAVIGGAAYLWLRR